MQLIIIEQRPLIRTNKLNVEIPRRLSRQLCAGTMPRGKAAVMHPLTSYL